MKDVLKMDLSAIVQKVSLGHVTIINSSDAGLNAF